MNSSGETVMQSVKGAITPVQKAVLPVLKMPGVMKLESACARIAGWESHVTYSVIATLSASQTFVEVKAQQIVSHATKIQIETLKENASVQMAGPGKVAQITMAFATESVSHVMGPRRQIA